VVNGFEYVCEACETTSVVRFTSEAEAEHLVTVHERLLHGGRPSCRIRAVYAVPGQPLPGDPTAVTLRAPARSFPVPHQLRDSRTGSPHAEGTGPLRERPDDDRAAGLDDLQPGKAG
jgi:hypothetical protein